MPDLIKRIPKFVAWAFVKPDGRIHFYGNGGQYQLPVFYTKKEALDWAREGSPGMGKVRKVSIGVEVIE